MEINTRRPYENAGIFFGRNQEFTLENLLGRLEYEHLGEDSDRMDQLLRDHLTPIFSKVAQNDPTTWSVEAITGFIYVFSTYADLKLRLKQDEANNIPIAESRRERIDRIGGHLEKVCQEVNRATPSTKDRIMLAIYRALAALCSLFPKACQDNLARRIQNIRERLDPDRTEQTNRIIQLFYDLYWDKQIGPFLSRELGTTFNQNDERPIYLSQQTTFGVFSQLITMAGIEKSTLNDHNNPQKWDEAYPNCPISFSQAKEVMENWGKIRDDLLDAGALENEEGRKTSEAAEGTSPSLQDTLAAKVGLRIDGGPALTEANNDGGEPSNREIDNPATPADIEEQPGVEQPIVEGRPSSDSEAIASLPDQDNSNIEERIDP